MNIEEKSNKEKFSRREFLKDISIGIGGIGMAVEQLSCSGLGIIGKKRDSSDRSFKMNYRRLGRTGFMVSEIGLGGHYNGPNYKEKQSEKLWQREAVFRECLKAGINFFDTNSESERISLGQVIKNVPMDRESIFIVTDINDQVVSGQELYNSMMYQIDVQLNNLQLPSVEIFRFSTVIRKTPHERMEAAFKAFKEMKKVGKVKYLAIAQHDPDLLLEWIDKYDEMDIIYVPYNYFANKAEEELFSAARKKDIGIVAIKPFNKGTIFNPELVELFKQREGQMKGTMSVVERAEKEGQGKSTEDLIKATGLTLAQASLRYIISNKDISTVIPGMETVEEVQENIRVTGTKFGSLEHSVLEQYTVSSEKLIPANYQWLKRWEHV